MGKYIKKMWTNDQSVHFLLDSIADNDDSAALQPYLKFSFCQQEGSKWFEYVLINSLNEWQGKKGYRHHHHQIIDIVHHKRVWKQNKPM